MHPLVNYMTSFFTHYLEMQRGLSVNTILSYRDSLKLFFCYAADRLKVNVEKLTIENLDEKTVLTFLEHLKTKRHDCDSTRNNRLAAIRTFFRYIGRIEPVLLEQVQTIRSIPQKKTQKMLITYLDENELASIMKTIDENGLNGRRDKALILFLYNTGARVQEVVDLNIDELRLDDFGQVKLLGKGGKQRACPLWPETVSAIKEYIERRIQQGIVSDVFILNNKKERITRFGIRYIVKKYSRLASLKCPSLKRKKISPHTYRHSTAMHLLMAGNDINMVQMWLGHSDLNTTHQYVELNMEMKREMLLKSSPPEENKEFHKPLWKDDKILKWLEELTYPGKLCEAVVP